MSKQDINFEWFGSRITGPQQLLLLAQQKRSVICDKWTMFEFGMKAKPAQVIANMNFTAVMQMISAGLYVYIPQGRSPRKTPDAWCKLCGFTIMDPDGWRESYNSIHDNKKWTDKITFRDFYNRSIISTILPIDNDRFQKYRNAKSWKDVV